MAFRADEVYQAGLELDLDERTLVAHRLLASLHPEEDGSKSNIDDAWRDEIGARVDEVLHSKVALSTLQQTRARARSIVDNPHA